MKTYMGLSFGDNTDLSIFFPFTFKLEFRCLYHKVYIKNLSIIIFALESF